MGKGKMQKLFDFTKESDKQFCVVINYLQKNDFDFVWFASIKEMFEYYDEEDYQCLGNWGITLFLKTGEIITIHEQEDKK